MTRPSKARPAKQDPAKQDPAKQKPNNETPAGIQPRQTDHPELIDESNPPEAFAKLSETEIRHAIRMTNLLLKHGYELDVATTIAEQNARHYAFKPSSYFERRPKKSRDQHVIPHPKGWAVIAANGRSLKVFSDEEQAIDAAQGLARKQKSVLVLHRATGEIRDQRNYLFGSDYPLKRSA